MNQDLFSPEATYKQKPERRHNLNKQFEYKCSQLLTYILMQSVKHSRQGETTKTAAVLGFLGKETVYRIY